MKSAKYEYEAEFNQPIEAVWERVSDILRLNELIGFDLKKAQAEIRHNDKLTVQRSATFMHIPMEWTETYGEWIKPYYLYQRLEFIKPYKHTMLVERFLISTKSGCKVKFSYTILWDSWIGTLSNFLGTFHYLGAKVFKKSVEMVYAKPNKYAGPEHLGKKPHYSQTVYSRVQRLVSKIDEAFYGHHLGQKIATYALNSMPVDVSKIRPRELAEQWRVEEDYAIEACVQAVRCGLLGMRWDLLCPQCRIEKANTLNLQQLPKGEHCEACNINFEVNFDKNVELTFFPAEWIRPCENATSCLQNPLSEPHIIVQIQLLPNTEKVLNITLKPGNYRCRVVGSKLNSEFEVKDDNNLPQLSITDQGIKIAGQNKIFRVNNLLNSTCYFSIEDLLWKDKVLTGQKVIAMQVFRDLCPEQLLIPGDDIKITNLSFVFTDLKDSTLFYYREGEANAYHIVREHLRFLAKLVYEHHGSVVKTIGDSVMAVFSQPHNAIQACLDVQAQLKLFNQQNKTDLVVKMGLNMGNCIAVNIDNKMDYFGNIINETARLASLSNGNDLVISRSLFTEESVKDLLAGSNFVQEQQTIKGIPGQVVFYRVTGKVTKVSPVDTGV